MNEDREFPPSELEQPPRDEPTSPNRPDVQSADRFGPAGTAIPLESATRADSSCAAPGQLPAEPALVEPPLFQSYSQPPPSPRRIPNFGDLLLLAVLLAMGLIISISLFLIAVHFHFLGASSIEQASTEIHYLLGTEAVIYLVTFGCALLVFPAFWHKGLFAGLQWHGETALRMRWRLIAAALACFVLALFSGKLMPSPTNTPIEKVFRTPGAAWLLFGFGVTFAPFFEEMFFRGFMLPSLCTAFDWTAEKVAKALPRPLEAQGNPQWSLAAMIFASIATSIPFAAMHAEQTGYSIGPFLLLMGVSLVLCGVRLFTRSLASSTLVHASYNFMIFTAMAIGTGGFKHLDKM